MAKGRKQVESGIGPKIARLQRPSGLGPKVDGHIVTHSSGLAQKVNKTVPRGGIRTGSGSDRVRVNR
jgi:hypothetical protein